MSETMTLMQASVALGLSYGRTLRLVLVRELRGEQRNGRWLVDSRDVARLVKARGRSRRAVSA